MRRVAGHATAISKLTELRNPLNLKKLYSSIQPSARPDFGGAIRLFVCAVLVTGGLLSGTSPLTGQDDGLERRVVRGLEFVGNRAIDDYTLSISIATSNSTWWARTPVLRLVGLGLKRYFDEREFRRDVLRLEFLYNRSGYPDARIDTLVRRTENAVSIRFLIHEGEPIRVTNLAITGVDDILSLRSLRQDLPLAEGDPFNRVLLLASADTIRVALQNRGYPFAEVFRSFHSDRETHEATVSFDVEPGLRATVGAVNIVGAEEIDAEAIRRMIPLRPGATYRLEDLHEAQRELYRMNVFNYVNVRLEDSLPDSPDDSLVSVRVTLTEGSLRRIRVGAGYGSLDCFRGVVGWSAGNFLGGGRTLEVTGRASKIGTGTPFPWGFEQSVCFPLNNEVDSTRLELNYMVTASLYEPHFFSRRASASVSVFAEKRSEFKAYVKEAQGGELAVTRQTGLGIPVTLTYALQFARTRAEPATFCTFLNVCLADDTVFTKRLLRSTVGLRVVRDRANSRLDPSRGSRAVAELRWASGLTGSDKLARFTRAVGELASYYRVGRRSIFAWRVRIGTLVPSDLSLEDKSVEFVPPDERFYGGGPNSGRGFGTNELGPLVRVLEPDGRDSVVVVDSAGVVDTLAGRLRTSPTGGNQLYFANVELRFPLPVFSGRLVGVVFVDAGQVFERGGDDVTILDVRVTPGVGVRLGSPLGPVRFDVAYNPYGETLGRLYRREGTQLIEFPQPVRPVRGTGFFDRLKLHFAVGQAF